MQSKIQREDMHCYKNYETKKRKFETPDYICKSLGNTGVCPASTGKDGTLKTKCS